MGFFICTWVGCPSKGIAGQESYDAYCIIYIILGLYSEDLLCIYRLSYIQFLGRQLIYLAGRLCLHVPITSTLYKHRFPDPSAMQKYMRLQVPFAFLAFSLASFSLLWITPSAPTPPNTKPTPTHCIPLSRCPNHITLNIIVNIFLVTVTVTSNKLENLLSV